MIVWLNGPFGVGKTTVTAALHAALPQAVTCDPEQIGWLLRRVMRVPTGDYQDLRTWRWLVVATVAALDHLRPGPVLVPMTLLRERSTREILGALRARGRDVRHVLLDVSGEELRWRIAAAPVAGPGEQGTRAWRSGHVDDYERARPRLAATADVVIDTTDRRPDEIADVLVRSQGLVRLRKV